MQSRVLIIDDYPDALDSLRLLLRIWGYGVEGAATARDGLVAFVAHKPEIVLVDLRLPDMEGCEVVRRLRSEHTDHNVFIIAHSGYPRLEAAARAAGADDFVAKPDVDALRRAFDRRDAVAGRAARWRNEGDV